MSSFKDNFKRDSEEDQLDYDDSAFYYFSLAVLTFILLPYAFYLLKTMIYGEVEVNWEGVNCETKWFQSLLKKKKAEAKKSIWTRGFCFKIFVGLFMGYLWYLNLVHVNSIEGLQTFDPYAILDLDTMADEKQIKKQYRKMSLIWHPDKNPGNPQALSKFISITKAYNILTDETARQNFLKYGNPDGPGNYNVAIAMPRFLLQKENQVQVLCVSFFILLVIIPGLVYINFADSTNKDEGGVLLENKRVFGAEINENMHIKNMPIMLSRAIEFQNLRAKSQQEIELLKKLKDDVRIQELLPKTVSKKTAQQNLKPLLLILGHMFRIELVQHPVFKESMETILKLTPQMVNLMGGVASELQAMNQRGQSLKRIPGKVFETIQVFQQYFVQGMWQGDDPLMQLPHFTPEVIKNYRKLLKEHNIANSSIDNFCRLSPQQRANLKLLSPDQMNEVEALVRVLPCVDVSARAFTEGENEMTMSDAISLKFTIKYVNLKEKEFPGFAHSMQYPYLKKQGWWILITDMNKDKTILAHKIIFRSSKNTEGRLAKPEEIEKEPLNEETFELRQRFGQVGTFRFTCTFFNDSYFGFEKEVPLEFTVVQDDTTRVIPEYSQEDLDAVKGPGLVQSMLDIKEGDSSDSDNEEEKESLDEVEILKRKLAKAGLDKAAEKRTTQLLNN